ncbi:glycosyltransferase family 4 protein [Bradyrhizobium jicamae]|uniref:Glycosyltransferase family 4 protein n=1 Tax=Bradyrhizobium jicamae TaxID=280332 RepID=A0ABS5FZP6_9BRAD|nr:glycosyltransferase family 4 protein [Bradyrhizobium jicamae]MBR0801691.1 glycosyltransferase family 4 protein [Bradyrhizobium jicamae]
MTKRSILFVTDELFLPLPPKNASGWLYYTIAETYKKRGWEVYCLSFFRDRQLARSPAVNAAYGGLFRDFLLLPGWNRGGHPLGAIGQVWREAERALTGNVLSSHPFLLTNNVGAARKIAETLGKWQVDVIYLAKPQSVQLLGRVLHELSGGRRPLVVMSAHDDFVSRAIAYRGTYQRLFDSLSLSEILRDHANAWVRHRLERIDVVRSRRAETTIFDACHLVRVESADEFTAYSRMNSSTAKLSHKPFSYVAPIQRHLEVPSEAFDAGFIGSNDVMNLDAVLYLRDVILPIIRKAAPEFRMLLAGGISSKVRPIVAGVGNVTVWESLDDVSSFYRAIRVAAVPLRAGTGVSIKVLEALSFGRPIVSTPVGVRGLPRKLLANTIVTSDPNEFAQALLRERLVADLPQDGLAVDG